MPIASSGNHSEGTLTTQSILWRSIHLPGHEACRLFSHRAEWHLEGTAVFSHLHQPCRLSYFVVCDKEWNTTRASVSGWVAETAVDIDLVVDREHRWRLNGIEQPAVAGCVDIDLNFSPSTNLLPIRRLNLEVGATGAVRAAWLRFPSFAVEPLYKSYTRLESRLYRYESAGGRFVAEVTVDETGLVVNYGDIWSRELGA